MRRGRIADSVGSILLAAGAPSGDGIAILLVPRDFAAVIGPDYNHHLPVDTLTASGEWAPPGTVALWSLSMGVFWQRDATFLYVGSQAADPNPAIFRLPRGGGAQERVGPIPVPDNPSVGFSSDFRRGVVVVVPVVSGIWLLKHFAPAIR